VPTIAPTFIRFLETRREDLNARFDRAQRRTPALDGTYVLLLLEEHLAPLAGDEPGADELLSSLYDLVLLHAGRDAFAARPALSRLFRVGIGAARRHCLERPRSLPAALSNAVENLETLGRGRGEAFVDGIAALAPLVPDAAALLDAGALLAWRLGEARLRSAALTVAARLPPAAVLTALRLADWPVAAAPLAIAALTDDAWHRPETRIAKETLANIAAASDPAPLVENARAALAAAPRGPLVVVGEAGAWAGFGGPFVAPPTVLAGEERHVAHLRVPAPAAEPTAMRVVADCYGAVFRPALTPAADVAPPRVDLKALLGARPASVATLGDGVLCAALADSHRLRFLAPSRGTPA
jgi:hypothetical protein